MTDKLSLKDTPSQHRKVRPLADVLEGPEAYKILLDVPGVVKDDVAIHVENRELRISAKRQGAVNEPVVYERYFTLPATVDSDKTEADLSAGVLTLTLHKHPEAKPRQIKVRAA